MITIWKREIKSSFISLLIWTLAVGGIGLACILLYASMSDSVKDIADSFATMGAFSEAFGMNTLSIATLSGYFATEVGTTHGLGSGMFAAAIAITVLSKEENNHSAEFLMSLPVSRKKVVAAKALAAFTQLVFFNICCALLYATGFAILGEQLLMSDFIIFMGTQLLMNIEIACICFMISSVSKDNKFGVGMGVALLLYLYDLMSRVIPTLKDSSIFTPYSFCNASEIFAGLEMNYSAIFLSVVIIVLCILASFICYSRRDLRS